ncbi:tRNA wybutosine-synthesizing protein 2 homolog [Convolutriloba macropyga]|uniref:tRNA wybutosine-synthesizing protein 2 homolog n=1 Tax=Convolutriloba macropyga TaxID=536237 RepID=UPI003F51DCC2
MPVTNLKTAVRDYFKLQDTSDELSSVPRKYQKHENCVVFNTCDFSHSFWKHNQSGLWEFIASYLKVPKIAVKSAIVNDDFRSPSCRLVYGRDPWVVHKDNGVKYCFDVTRSMFSFGNISEKMRVAMFDCSDEVVVDLFAGIGYFTLPYLLHANAKFVYACEWNPVSCEGLRRALEMNNVTSKCEILEGDNRIHCPRSVCDRVNLGLIPECSGFYETACNALREGGGMLHVHRNVTTSGDNKESGFSGSPEVLAMSHVTCSWKAGSEKERICANVGLSICNEIQEILKRTRSSMYSVELLNVAKVKNYAPHIQHFVFDISIKLC